MQLKSLAAVGRRPRLNSRLSIGLTARCGPICTDNFARGRQLTVLNCPSSSTTLKAQRSSSHRETAEGFNPSEGCNGQRLQFLLQKHQGVTLKRQPRLQAREYSTQANTPASRTSQRHIQKRYSVDPFSPTEDDFIEKYQDMG